MNRLSLALLVLSLSHAGLAQASLGSCEPTSPEATKVVRGWMSDPDAPVAGRERVIEVEATIQTDGRATQLRFADDVGVSASGRQAVRNAVSLWRFKPATACGEQIAGDATLLVPMMAYAPGTQRPVHARLATDAQLAANPGR